MPKALPLALLLVVGLAMGCSQPPDCKSYLWVSFAADSDGKSGTGIVLNSEGQGTYYMVATDPIPNADPNKAPHQRIAVVTFDKVRAVKWVDYADLPRHVPR